MSFLLGVCVGALGMFVLIFAWAASQPRRSSHGCTRCSQQQAKEEDEAA